MSRPHPYADRDTAEICGSASGRIYQGKSAIAIARRFTGRQKNFSGQNFWARGYYVSTVGRDEATIRRYILEQEAEDKRLDQLEMFKDM
jgi:putative transposase